MTGLIWVSGILLFLVLLSFLRIKARVRYDLSGFTAQARLGPVAIPLYPRPEKKAAKTEKREEPAKKPKPGGFAAFKEILSPALKSFGYLLRGVRIDLLELGYTAASADPSKTAMIFGASAAGIGGVLSILENLFVIKKRSIRVNADFSASEATILFSAMVSLPIWRALFTAIKFAALYIKTEKKPKIEDKVV